MLKTNLSGPVYFPSISSVAKTKWDVGDFVDFLVASQHPYFLVSCYDLYNNKRKDELLTQLKRSKQDQFILLDSGIYEQVWHQNSSWNIEKYHEIISNDIFSEAFCYDSYFLSGKEISVDDIYKSIIDSRLNDVSNRISPIVHCNCNDDFAGYSFELMKMVSPSILAFPERELGRGVFEIAKKIIEIRETMNAINSEQIIHILGTGNPISIMLYYFAGANTFDGLDWCQTVVDFDTAKLHHYQHLDLYKHQSKSGLDMDYSFMTRCYLHNLEFYTWWTSELKNIHTSNDKEKMLERYLPNQISKDLFKEILCK